MKLDPLEVTQRIHDDYTRYLRTIYFFRDPDLRQQFWDALNKPDFLVRGPLLEAAMPFRLGRSISEMAHDGVLSNGFFSLCSEALPLERGLYYHQATAIRKIVVEKRNVVVATGTGSGKTEAFLIPILDHLLREQETGSLVHPGVRALLLYPMNALANDQLKRLRRVLGKFPDITFGRYTGETEEDDRVAEDRFLNQFPDEPRIPNELLSRRQIRGTPPHILLTNYAMLEYLLLRPEDCELFDGVTGQFWRFIVLDEAHTYDGAAGIEVAMLLRRLKDRVTNGAQGQLTCIATSATLGQGRQDFPAVARFASELFGEPFEWIEDNPDKQDVVEAQREPESAIETSWGEGTAALYEGLITALGDMQDLESIQPAILNSGVPKYVVQEALTQALEVPEDERIGRLLYLVLRGDSRLRCLRQALTEPNFLEVLANEVFQDDKHARQHLTYLVDLATKARPGKEEVPLLPTRYHLFARALEGAFVCLNKAAHQEGGIAAGKPTLFLTQQKVCPYCGSTVFELATCPRCGTAYIVGQEVNEGGVVRLKQGTTVTEESPGSSAYFALTSHSQQPDEDEAVVLGQDLEKLKEEKVEPYNLCLGCGALSPQGQDVNCGCPDDTPHVLVQRVRLDREATTLTRCVVCGARRSSGAVYRFRTGRDAPVSVLATSLYQSLPPEGDKQMQSQPGKGRKLLAFSDSRQDAAFFAPYVERTYQRMLQRRLILKALLEDDAGRAGQLRLDDMTNRLLQQAEHASFFTLEQSYDERMRILRTWLMQELIALDYRIGLEGLGLLTFGLVKPQGWSPPRQLIDDPWNLSADEVWKLLLVLLDGLRRQGAITYPQGVDPRDNAFAPRNKELFMREAKGDSKLGLLGWLPGKGSNRRLDFLVRLLAHSSSLSKDKALFTLAVGDMDQDAPTAVRNQACGVRALSLSSSQRYQPR